MSLITKIEHAWIKLKVILHVLRTPVDQLAKKAASETYRLTTPDSPTWSQDPLLTNKSVIRFYQLKPNLGVFEIHNIVKKPDREDVLITIYNSSDDVSFTLTRKWFEYLFEPMTLPKIEKETP